MPCPFPGEEDKEREESDEDAKTGPNYWLIAAAVATAEMLRRHERGVKSKYDVLSEAEDVVARHAEEVPMPVPQVGRPVASLRGELLAKGAATAATGIAAALAIRYVASYRGGGGGFQFMSRLDPMRPQRAR